MEERRKAQRFPIELHASCIGDNGDSKKHCKVIEISRDGLAIQLYSKDKISTGRNLVLEIDIPSKREAIRAVMVLKWAKTVKQEAGYGYLAGGELTSIEKKEKLSLLEYGYENWRRHEDEA